MGKAKFIIVAAIILFVQSGSAQTVSNPDNPVQIKKVSAADDCDWPMFGRTPDGNRVVPDGCGINNFDFKGVWSKKISSRSPYSPLFSNNRLFQSFQDNFLYCLDVKNGGIVWKQSSNWWIIDPLFSNEQIFFGNKGVFNCYSSIDGSLLWQSKIPELVGSSVNLLKYGNNLYFTTGSKVMCIDSTNGKPLWSQDKYYQGHNFRGIVIDNGDFFYRYSQNEIRCLDCKTGEIKWKYSTSDNTYKVMSTLVVSNGKLFATTGEGLICIDTKTGMPIWKREYPTEGVVCYKDRLYLIFGMKLIEMDANRGIVEWESDILHLDNIPLISGDYIFCPSFRTESKIYVFDIKEKNIIKEIKYTNLIDFLLYDNKLFLFSYDGMVSCLSSENTPIEPVKIDISNNGVKVVDFCYSVRFSATVFDQNNNEIKDPELEWSVDPAFGTIDSTGLFKPSKTGVATITCRCGDAVATVDINVVDYLVPSVKTLVLSNVKPYQDYKTTLTYTNNSDARLDVKLTSTTDLVTLSPTSFSVDAGKTFDILVSCKLKEFVPSAVTSFTINADYGGCPDILHGTIMNADKYDCFKVSPEMLDFGLVKRGDSKTLALTIESNAKQILAISCDQPWVEISKKSLSVDVGQKETIDFKIMASSLPASSKLTANITIISDMNFCEQTTIPLLVSTEDSITIKLQVDSRNATINGQERMLDVPARIIAGRTMVPLRFISESFGCSILWDPVTQKIGIVRYDITVNLWIGKDFVEVNGNKLKIDAPPVIVGGRTMVPLRFIAEPFGAKVDWNAQAKEITITWPK